MFNIKIITGSATTFEGMITGSINNGEILIGESWSDGTDMFQKVGYYNNNEIKYNTDMLSRVYRAKLSGSNDGFPSSSVLSDYEKSLLYK